MATALGLGLALGRSTRMLNLGPPASRHQLSTICTRTSCSPHSPQLSAQPHRGARPSPHRWLQTYLCLFIRECLYIYKTVTCLSRSAA